MEASFWHSCWADGRIGFHQSDINPYLQKFIQKLNVSAGARILVPLCGKSLDMLWLAQKGYRVSGVELSRKAVEDFFSENRLEYQVSDTKNGRYFVSDQIEIWCADFFSNDWSASGSIDAVYDRAAVVALPPDLRRAYAARLASILQAGAMSLLVTLEYPVGEINGPPFSVQQDEVRELFSGHFEIELLHSEDCLALEPRFKARGVTRMDERVYLLRKT